MSLKRDASERESDDLAIALAGPPGIAAALRAHGYRVLPLSAQGEPPGGSAPPRVCLLGDPSDETAPRLELVRAVRERWPLVDVVALAPGASSSRVRDLLKAGAIDVVLDAGEQAVLAALDEALEAQQLLPMVERLADRRVHSSRFEGLLSRSPAMWEVFETCSRVAPTDANVLICGETGTGKELLAHALHRRSQRPGRLVTVNCSSMPQHLIESELFGHEKGAFTGAIRSRPGIFRHAEGGTVFLDEIGDMPLGAQQSLLRVLEERSVRPVGGSEEVAVDVRVVAATNVPLEEAVAGGSFREDLFYRLDVIRLELPPLRERPEDVVYLFGHFVKSLASHYGVPRPEMDVPFLMRLTEYPWPGNVRELENFVERLLLRGKRRFAPSDFERYLRPAEEAAVEEADETPSSPPPDAGIDTSRGLEETLRPVVERVERRYLEAVLARTGGRVQEAARLAGVSRRTLQRKLAQHGIDKTHFRGLRS